MILYKNTTVMAHLLDENTDVFKNVTGVVQGDILAPYLLYTGSLV